MNIFKLVFFSLLLLPACVFSQTRLLDNACNSIDSKVSNTNMIACYRETLAKQRLDYRFVSNQAYPREYRYLLNDIVPARYAIDPSKPPVQINRYQMLSQHWSPDGLVTPGQWHHDVNIYIPKNARGTRALIAVDLSEKMMAEIAQSTNTIVVSLDNIPAIGLEYQHDGISRVEDDSIARSWQLTMQSPQNRALLPLHVPMAEAISQTIRLAKKELRPWHIDKFIVTGASKRGWATWLAGISDPSVEAIVPFVADALNTQDIVKHMYRVYGGNWPIAFKPYYDNQIDLKLGTPAFEQLMKIEDPLQYLATDARSRLAIPKYIINASGDDFFPPDDTRYYFDPLPGEKSLRIVPNSDHLGIVNVMQQSLVAFINRLQDSRPLPTVTVTNSANSDVDRQVSFSEKPVKVLQWTATNPDSRDFRYACGIRYASTRLTPSPQNTVNLSLDYAGAGWQARFIEATFADGYVATSQVYITPDAKYPVTAPLSAGKTCQTLPGRNS